MLIMNNPDTELLFPMRVIPSLRDQRGEDWSKLVDQIVTLPEWDSSKIAFSSMMMKLAGCLGCSADSFRALRGCTQCSKVIIKRYKGSDQDLLNLFTESKVEIERIFEKPYKSLKVDNDM